MTGFVGSLALVLVLGAGSGTEAIGQTQCPRSVKRTKDPRVESTVAFALLNLFSLVPLLLGILE